MRKLAADKMRSPILCFVGPPGTGKTSSGQVDRRGAGPQVRARQPGRHPRRGRDPRPSPHLHRRAAGPHHPDDAHAGPINPVFMLDEIDKLGIDFRGDPAVGAAGSAGPEQNYAFSRSLPGSAVRSVARSCSSPRPTSLDPIPPALRDRMEVIEFPGYIEEEKLDIAAAVPDPAPARGARPQAQTGASFDDSDAARP